MLLKKKKNNVGVQNTCLEKKGLRGWGETLGPRSAFQNGMNTKPQFLRTPCVDGKKEKKETIEALVFSPSLGLQGKQRTDETLTENPNIFSQAS